MSNIRFKTLAVVAAIILGSSSVILAQRSRITASPEDLTRQAAAFETGGLRAAAAVNGFYVSTQRFKPEPNIGSLDDLVRASHVVIAARVMANVGKATADGRSVYTEYILQVESVLRGALEAPTVLAVIPGGRVEFDTGVAQINVAGLRRPMNGQSNLWFLRRARPEFGADKWTLVGGPLGLFTVIADVVRPAGGFDAPLARALLKSRPTFADFVASIRGIR